MSYLNFIKEHEIWLPKHCARLSGEFRMEAFKGIEFPRGSGNVYEIAGSRRVVMDWAPNMIVNSGLDHYGNTGGGMNYCLVGTDGTPPVATDTVLGGYVATNNTKVGNTVCGAQASPPYFGWIQETYRFNPGFGGGDVNLNEVGIGPNSTNTSLTARALTVNGSGTPTTVSVLADEYLDVVYKRRNYPDHITEATGAPTDTAGSISIRGSTYNYTIRPAYVTYGGSVYVGTARGWGQGLSPKVSFSIGFAQDIYSEGILGSSTCTHGSVTAGLSAYMSSGGGTAGVEGSYTNGTYTKEVGNQWDIDNGNGTFKGVLFKGSLGAYQIVLDATVTKVYGEVFTWYQDYTWADKGTWV